MKTTYIDCSHEAGDIRRGGSERMRWLAQDIEPSDWIVEITPQALEEIDRLADYLQRNPLPLLQRRIDAMSLPACRELMARMKHILVDGGPTIAVWERLEARLEELRRDGGFTDQEVPLPLELVMVSHIDDDHIDDD